MSLTNKEWIEANPLTNVACFRIRTNKGDYEETHGPCHYSAMGCMIKYTTGKLGDTITGFDNSLTYKNGCSAEVAFAYYEYFLSKERSPYRFMYKDTEIHMKDGKHIGFSFNNCEHPTVAHESWMIASRLPSEFPAYARTFHFLVKGGMKEAEAFMICHISKGMNKKDDAISLMPAGGHTAMGAFDANYALCNYSVKRFTDANPEYKHGDANNLYSKKMDAANTAHSFWTTTKLEEVHPWDVDKKGQKAVYYEGNFPYWAQYQVKDFPMAVRNGGVNNHYGSKTVETLVKERTQWSPL